MGGLTLPDDQYVAVVQLDTAMQALGAMIEARRGYLKLVETMLAPFPVEHQHDQSKRNQMITLLSRADTLWILKLVHMESKHTGRRAATSALNARKALLGEYLTRATIAKGLAIVESGNKAAAAERRHTVAASRIVEAGIAYALFEFAPQPDAKQQPIVGTLRLAKFLHAIGDHAFWAMKEALSNEGGEKPAFDRGLREDQAEFELPADINREQRPGRVTAEDVVMDWLELSETK